MLAKSKWQEPTSSLLLLESEIFLVEVLLILLCGLEGLDLATWRSQFAISDR